MKACMLVETTIVPQNQGPGKGHDVAARLRKTPGVEEAWTAFGPSDIVALVEVEDVEALDLTVSEAGQIQGIAGIETLPEIEVP